MNFPGDRLLKGLRGKSEDDDLLEQESTSKENRSSLGSKRSLPNLPKRIKRGMRGPIARWLRPTAYQVDPDIDTLDLAPSFEAQKDYGRLSGYLIDRRTALAAEKITGESVLDAGCNIAPLAAQIASNTRYLGIEIVPEIAELASRLHPTREFMALDISQDWPLDLLERRFDHIVLLAVLEHLSDPLKIITACEKVLNPGGTMIITTPHPRAQRLHTLGAKIGLFSRDADEEHEAFLDRASLAQLAWQAGLSLQSYRRFQLGMNQLAVFSRPEDLLEEA